MIPVSPCGHIPLVCAATMCPQTATTTSHLISQLPVNPPDPSLPCSQCDRVHTEIRSCHVHPEARHQLPRALRTESEFPMLAYMLCRTWSCHPLLHEPLGVLFALSASVFCSMAPARPLLGALLWPSRQPEVLLLMCTGCPVSCSRGHLLRGSCLTTGSWRLPLLLSVPSPMSSFPTRIQTVLFPLPKLHILSDFPMRM